jgi:predicted Zn-dependent protease
VTSGTGLGEGDLEALADRVVSLVGDRGEAAVTVAHVRQGLTRFANSFIHQNVGDEHVSVTLKVVANGRPASSTTSRVDDDALRRLVEVVVGAADVQPVDQHWPGLSPPAPLLVAPGEHFDQETAEAGPAERAEVVAAFVAAGEGLRSAGYCETGSARAAFANSRGQRLSSSATTAVVDGIHRLGGADGAGSVMSGRLADIDGAAAGAVAAETARRGGGSVTELPPGAYEVVLGPRCVAYMLDFFTFLGFNAKAVQDGRSFVKLAEQQLDERLSIWDDATDERQPGLAFDAEGTPKRRVELVNQGLVTGVAHDRRTAAVVGAESTGHAVPDGAVMGAVATNVFLAGAATSPVAELVSRVERGLLVKDFWYCRVLDPKTLVVTGLTRNGLFLIERGRVGPAVSNLRFTQSPAAAFGPGRVLGVGDDAALAQGGLHISRHHAPTLHLASWNFTGNASG